jgi:hypothetical protein
MSLACSLFFANAALMIASLAFPSYSLVLRMIFSIGFILLLLAAGFLGALRKPLLAYENGHLAVRLRFAGIEHVPIDLVECFLLGQGPTWLPGKKYAKTETVTLVVRLAERAVEWSHRPTHPMLGTWCDGYITIRGTWCEPLSLDLVNRLNRRLAEVQQESSPAEKVAP